jgi:hypothetical protein
MAFAGPASAYLLASLNGRDAVRDAVGGAVRGAVDGVVRGAVDDAVDDAVRGAVRDAVRDAVDDAVRDADALRTIRDTWWYRFGGQLWPGWHAYVSFFLDVCGLTLGEEMDRRARAYIATVESACWWWPHRDFVIVCERPTHIDRDEQGRLHSESRPAIAWPDGWGVYAWHGLRVPADVILHPENITVARIEAEHNSEQRRVLVERYGMGRYLKDAGAVEIHRDETGILWRKDEPGDEPILMVQVANSTPEPDGSRREYFLAVHPELRPVRNRRVIGSPQKMTARNAVASTFGLRGEQYAPTAES